MYGTQRCSGQREVYQEYFIGTKISLLKNDSLNPTIFFFILLWRKKPILCITLKDTTDFKVYM